VPDTHFLVSGRWDNTVALVSLERALDPENFGADRAVIARPRVTPDIEVNGRIVPASGQPVSVAVAAGEGRAYVVNHSGSVTPAEAARFQHGHPGAVAVLDFPRLFDPAADGTLAAIAAFVPTETAGPVGCALSPDGRLLAVASAEAPGCEDGGARVTLIDAEALAVRRQVRQPVRVAGAVPSRHAAPHSSYGAFPNANGVAMSPLRGGLIFTANGGTDDVSAIGLAAALAGERETELARIPVEAGPFGIAVSPDGRLVAVASRESARTGVEGRTVSFIDAEGAACGQADAEIARVPIGSDDPAEGTRPFAVAFTPDGRSVVATAFRSNTVSLVDVGDALAGRSRETARLTLAMPDGGPSRPRGVAIAPDGRHAAIAGAPKGAPRSSMLWIVALDDMRVAGLVTGVGNESYFLAALSGAPAI
jgi:DNA-binding beta-propeller fold protein YncE